MTLKFFCFTLWLYDPKAMENAKWVLDVGHPAIQWCGSPIEATEDMDAILLPTEWTELNALDFEEVGRYA